MAEDIKGLIEKIHTEGVKAAEDKARAIEDQARRRGQEIIARAERQAQKLIAQAHEEIARLQQSSQEALKQAARDMLLALRKEINLLLDRLVTAQLRQALKPAELIKIIRALVKDATGKEKADIVVSLSKPDLQKLRQGFLGQLKDEIKKGVAFKPSEEIQAGFVISYDRGRSHFDFSDKGLSEYLTAYLRPKLAEVLKAQASVDKKSKRSG